jgi:hypothetical protein
MSPIAKLAPSPGTKAAMWGNIAAAILGLANQVAPVVPPQYGLWLAIAATALNGGLHALTGNSPVIGG